MTVGSSLAASVSGLKANALRINVAANNIVNQDTQGFKAAIVRSTSVSNTPTPEAAAGSLHRNLKAIRMLISPSNSFA